LNSQILGLILGFVTVFVSIKATDQAGGIFFNELSILIVFGGTFSASILTFGIGKLRNLFSSIVKIFFRRQRDIQEVIAELVEISNKKNQGHSISKLISERADYHPFIIDGLRLLENDLEEDKIKAILEISLIERKNNFLHDVEILRTLAKYPPAFGMIGTVIGLVAVLQGLGSSTEITSIGPSMAIALITTLYGLFLSNIFFTPLGDNLLQRLNHSTNIRKMIIRGVLLLKEGQDSIYLQEVLNAHLLPEKRKGYILKEDRY
jgi:chemotaxis protein MotA